MDTYSEKYRRECEIRDLCAKTDRQGVDWLKRYVQKWKRWESLRDDFWRQWRAGNRGEPGDWR